MLFKYSNTGSNGDHIPINDIGSPVWFDFVPENDEDRHFLERLKFGHDGNIVCAGFEYRGDHMHFVKYSKKHIAVYRTTDKERIF